MIPNIIVIRANVNGFNSTLKNSPKTNRHRKSKTRWKKMYLASTYQRNLFKQNDERNNKEEMIMDLYAPHQSAGII